MSKLRIRVSDLVDPRRSQVSSPIVPDPRLELKTVPPSSPSYKSCVDHGKGYSLLVHNISHSDILFTLGDDDNQPLLARPRFSCFQYVGSCLLEHLRSHGLGEDIKYSTEQAGTSVPIGYNLKHNPLSFKQWEHFCVKTQSGLYQTNATNHSPQIIDLFFPIASLVLSKWLQIVPIDYSGQTQHILYLLSGAGEPKNKNHSATGNSTQSAAELVKQFVQHFYPNIVVVCMDSGSGVFKYDDNINFVNRVLRVEIDSRRQELADIHGSNWLKKFRLFISLSDGALARVLSIQTSLRKFRPDALHVWQIKSFWHGWPKVHQTKQLDFGEVEFQPFHKTELSPPIPVEETSAEIQRVVQEMAEHKSNFDRVIADGSNDLQSFWLRKSQQPVLAILMTQKENEQPKYWRGMNLEVSMPTGSLCSERNAIGHAVAYDATLCRRHMKIIAVLAPSARPDNPYINPLAPWEWLKKLAEMNPSFRVITFKDTTLRDVFVDSVL